MIAITEDDLQRSTAAFVSGYEESSKSGFTEDMFLEKSLPRASKAANRTYPYQVRIPKGYAAMMGGDFEPERVLTIKEPFQGPYGEMWFGDSTKGFQLMVGYKKGDSRFCCDKKLGDDFIHGILVGATGQGKSVTLNAIIYGGCYVYPPWELKLTLCDAKIVEFKDIALNNPMPQISSVAATGDADYLISVLQDKVEEMNLRNNIFTVVGRVFGKPVKKIEEFREVTGLAMPQIIIIIDEFQVMFQKAGKKSAQLNAAILEFAKLGRNTGIHLLLASQEVGSDLPPSVMANISMRMAMGCFPNVSEAVLGNDGAAANMGKKGYMIMNTDAAQKNNKIFNVLYRVPFAPASQLKAMSRAIIDADKDLHTRYNMNFYDEQECIYEKDFIKILTRCKPDRNTIYLGEPAFILNDEKKCLHIDLTSEELENIAVVANSDHNLCRYVKMLKANMELSQGCQQIVLCSHPAIEKDTGISSWVGSRLYFVDKRYEGSQFFAIAKSTVYKRRMILDADNAIFSGESNRNEQTEPLFDEYVGKGSEYDTDLNRERFAQYLSLTASDENLKVGLQIADLRDKALLEARANLAAVSVMMCDDYGASKTKLTVTNMPVNYFWIIGLDRIIGLGRSAKSRNIEDLLRVLQDCCETNCRFIGMTTTFTDITQLLGGFKWFIMEGIPNSEISKLKCDSYPNEVSKGLGLLWNSVDTSTGCLKFKKMLLDGELLI